MTASAPAGVLYGLIADASQWPLFFQPCLHVEQLDFDGTHERLRMWAAAGEEIASWVSRRRLDVGRHRVEFHQDVTAAPVESMRGTWSVTPLGDSCRVTLEHAFTVTGDDPAAAARLERITHANSRAQLDRLAWLAERWARLDDLVLSFEDTVRLKAPAELVFDFLYRAADWPGRLPHVHGVRLTEDTLGVQVMAMDSTTGDGSAHRTESVRMCFPGAGRIVYKQTRTAPLLAAHTGEWCVDPDASGLDVTARHTVLLREDALERVLGPGATVEQARRHLREELGRASRTVLEHAAHHAAGAVRVL
ncbi:aromatase/cyclase [Streptomyces sp. Tu 3180]|uniref:aromatase/cyclase n=1 Tax=Streptomyces sp. Tu 3180 TaxID=2682611 RepID=UPI001FB75160|nr:aromatase/cyclase [Streptomyces sp. Tu 3180]